MASIIVILGMLGGEFFFALSSILGYEYKGIEFSNIYLFYVITVAVLNVLLFIDSFARKKEDLC